MLVRKHGLRNARSGYRVGFEEPDTALPGRLAFPVGKSYLQDVVRARNGGATRANVARARGQPPQGPCRRTLGVGVLARPPVADRQTIEIEVVRDEVAAGPPHVRGVGLRPLDDLLELES